MVSSCCRKWTRHLLSKPVALSLLIVPALFAGCRADASSAAASRALAVGFVAPDSGVGESALRGAELGADEASRTGALLGRQFDLRTAAANGVEETVAAAKRLIDEGAVAIVGGFDEQSCAALADVAAARGVLFMNVGCRSDALRSASNSRVFHIEASDSMYLAAVAGMRGTGGDAPVLWHAGLARYGAAQLNQRFLRRHGRSADAPAWASWMAMKVLWQVSSESDAPGNAAGLASGLRGKDDGFDGHKGEALRFDSASRQLRQPLFPVPRTSAARTTDGGPPAGIASDAGRAALRRAAAAGERLLVVTNEGSADVMILNARTGEPLATIPFDERPRGIQVSSNGLRVWVALSDESPNEEGDGDGIAEIDLREGRVVARHAAGSDPEQFAVSADGSLIVAANEDAGTATLTDRRTSTALATLVVGIEPEGAAMSPDGRWAYITAETSNTVSVIDTRLREVVRSFLVDERPRAAAFAPDGARAYVTNEISGTLSVIDVSRHAVISTVALANGTARPVGVVVSPDSRRVYVANGRANSVSVVDAATLRETRVIAVGARPWGIALSRDGSQLYSANGGSNDVSVIDARAGRVTGTIKVGDRPWGVVVTR